jgi:hypothetical protein
MSTDNKSSVEQLLEHKTAEIEQIEDDHLSPMARFRRRWLKGRVFAAWQLSSWVTLGQVLIGKKLWLALASKFPSTATFFSKLWGGIVAIFYGAVEVVTP